MKFFEIDKHQRSEHAAEMETIRQTVVKFTIASLKLVGPPALLLMAVLLYGIFVLDWISASWWLLVVTLYIDGCSSSH